MATWKPASIVFHGGTQQINALKGKRVRTKANLLSARVFDPIHHQQTTTNVPFGAIGFVSNSQNDSLLIVFPKQPNLNVASLESLSRSGAFFVVVINAPTFKLQFDVDTDTPIESKNRG